MTFDEKFREAMKEAYKWFLDDETATNNHWRNVKSCDKKIKNNFAVLTFGFEYGIIFIRIGRERRHSALFEIDKFDGKTKRIANKTLQEILKGK